jgi:hypothetical protein
MKLTKTQFKKYIETKVKQYLNESAQIGSVASVDLSTVRKYMGDVPKYMNLLKKIIEKGHGKVEIVDVNMNDAKIKPYKVKDFNQDVFVPRQALINEQKEISNITKGQKYHFNISNKDYEVIDILPSGQVTLKNHQSGETKNIDGF